MIGIVVPTKRPHLLQRIRDMARAQGPKNTLIPITGDGPPGVLRNQGVHVARQMFGIRLVAFWDDDDFYGPDYLDEQLAAWQPGRVVGKTFGFVAFNKGVAYFPTPKNFATRHLLIGGTILGHVDQMPDFKDMPVGEDGQFASDCRKFGLETYVTSGRNFVYSRLGDKKLDHTFQAGDGLVWITAGGEGVPTSLTPEQAMAAEVPIGAGVTHKEWADGTEPERHRVSSQA